MGNNQLTSVEWLINQINSPEWQDRFIWHKEEIFKEAKQMQKVQERQKLIGLLSWMNKVAAQNPMALETDHDDIVDMYLSGYFQNGNN